jgi:predicted NBD/HSP70 family sugar kinase
MLTNHGSLQLPSVIIDSYNVELRDDQGFIGDRASKRAFQAILDDWRERLVRNGAEDLLGDKPSQEFSKKKLDKLFLEGDPESAALVQSAIEDFAQELATVVRRFLRLKAWRDTQAIVVGGGFRDSRMGELAIGRATILLKADGIDLTLTPIRHHPDEAGLIGACQLAPAWMFKGHDGLLAIDIGGTNVRAGIVCPNLKKEADASKAEVWKSVLWRHRDDDPAPTRAGMVKKLIRHA